MTTTAPQHETMTPTPPAALKVSEAVGRIIARMGAAHVFGVVGSGNFRATNALIAPSDQRPDGIPFTAARHEMGAACMADAYSRSTGRLSVVTVHQGCGLSNALTGIGEAAKSRTPVLVISGDTPGGQYGSNFYIDQDKVVEGMGAVAERLHSPASAVADTIRAVTRAVNDRRTVVLSMPLDVQEGTIPEGQRALVESVSPPVPPTPAGASPEAVERIAELLAGAERPVIVGGRGAAAAVGPIRDLAERAGALLTTSAVGRGLFHEDPWHLDVMGGFSTDGAAELVRQADVMLVFGAALNRWTTRDGTHLRGKTVIQVDDTPRAFGLHYPVDLEVLGDAGLTASAAAVALGERLASTGGAQTGYRTEETRARVAESLHWRDQPFEDVSEPVVAGDPDSGRIDPRLLTNRLDEMVPMERVVVPDGGNFNAYPAMHFRVPDNTGYCVPLAFQSIGLALSSAMGSQLASPDRIAIAGVGDGGLLMSLVELETAVRLRMPLMVVVYNDAAYGAEVHHFVHETDRLDTVQFPPTDIAAIAAGFGCASVTVRQESDLGAVQEWLDGPRDRPILIDAKIADFPSWVLAHSFADGE
ncbi:thiamine pyrophosphate-binding protein [Citricoccus zhacaiensis]